MERLTEKLGNANIMYTSDYNNLDITRQGKFREDEKGIFFVEGKAIDKLAEYENTGLEPKEVEELKKSFDMLLVGIDLLEHGKDYRFRNEDNSFYSRESCCDLTIENTVKQLLNELGQTEKCLENFSNNEYKLFDEIKKLEHDLEVYKIAFRNVLYDADKKINTVYKNYGYCSVKMKNSQYYLEQAEKKLKGGCNDD